MLCKNIIKNNAGRDPIRETALNSHVLPVIFNKGLSRYSTRTRALHSSAVISGRLYSHTDYRYVTAARLQRRWEYLVRSYTLLYRCIFQPAIYQFIIFTIHAKLDAVCVFAYKACVIFFIRIL